MWSTLLSVLSFSAGSSINRALHSFPTRRSSDLGSTGHMFKEHSYPITTRGDVNLVVGTYMVPEVFPSVEDIFAPGADRKSTRLNSSHVEISYAVFCLKKKNSCSG